MRIAKLELQNFRCFEHYEIEFSEHFTLLIGDNGSGKTAILDALSFGFRNYFINLYSKTEEIAQFAEKDKRYVQHLSGQSPLREKSGNILLNFFGVLNQQKLSWVESEKSQQQDPLNRLFPISYLLNVHTLDLLPALIKYSTNRLWKQSSAAEVQTLSPSSRLAGYEDYDNANPERMFRWFKTQEIAALQKKETRYVLEAVRTAIISMIPDAKHIYWDFDWDELMLSTNNEQKSQTLPFSMLSDGCRNLLAMVADIAYRMACLNPQLEADILNQTEGIVLIDEIDLHLHPKWQRIVVDRLLATFPKVQFVATSHSPFIIQSLYGRSDVSLWDLDSAQALPIDSKSIEDIAENKQGVDIPQQSQRYLDMQAAASEFYSVLQQIPAADSDEVSKLKSRLDELMEPYSDDAAFQAFLKMERLAKTGESG